MRKTSVAMLQDLGHQILIARNAAEALALVKEASAPMRASDPIDILFTDVVMPGGMSGIELANQAVAVSPALKVLITTGYPGHVELLRNEFAVLPKPFTRLDLELLIRSLVDRRGQKNQEENRLDSGSAPVLNEGGCRKPASSATPATRRRAAL